MQRIETKQTHACLNLCTYHSLFVSSLAIYTIMSNKRASKIYYFSRRILSINILHVRYAIFDITLSSLPTTSDYKSYLYKHIKIIRISVFNVTQNSIFVTWQDMIITYLSLWNITAPSCYIQYLVNVEIDSSQKILSSIKWKYNYSL